MKLNLFLQWNNEFPKRFHKYFPKNLKKKISKKGKKFQKYFQRNFQKDFLPAAVCMDQQHLCAPASWPNLCASFQQHNWFQYFTSISQIILKYFQKRQKTFPKIFPTSTTGSNISQSLIF